MHDLIKRLIDAKFDAGAVLRAKNNPLWRVFDKAVIEEGQAGMPLVLRFTVPDTGQSVQKPLDEAWVNGETDKELVETFLRWLQEARGETDAAGETAGISDD